jgi:predicted transcriptional regulator
MHKDKSASMALKIFGGAVEHLRRKRRISQSRLAKLTGLTQASISRIEAGEQDCGIEHAVKILSAIMSEP